MKMKNYDTFVMGHISIDENIYQGKAVKEIGGAVVYSSCASYALGHKIGILTKLSFQDKDCLEMFTIPEEDVFALNSKNTTSIRNIYHSVDRERRTCTALSVADPFTIDDIPDNIDSQIYHFAGLISGEFDSEMIKFMHNKGKVALDVQGFLRNVGENKEMVFKDWKKKKEYLPYIDYLKTDAAEAEIMTGTKDRKKAAGMLFGWGAKEIMITHNKEVLIYNGKKHYICPLKSRNLSGRTGRGDTCFSAYITERLNKGIEEALLFATALVSLKMERPGPFKGTRDEVEDYIKKFYQLY
ncbi:MAG TPA: ribokinase [Candidatus Atribacteria bacterium]|jgi:sugar/nucleoside kinase (ribokinase family)|nr:ribokinase [Candidatus Atribacteria bacterium]